MIRLRPGRWKWKTPKTLVNALDGEIVLSTDVYQDGARLMKRASGSSEREFFDARSTHGTLIESVPEMFEALVYYTTLPTVRIQNGDKETVVDLAFAARAVLDEVERKTHRRAKVEILPGGRA